MSLIHSLFNKKDGVEKLRDAESMSPKEQLTGMLVVLFILLLALALRSM